MDEISSGQGPVSRIPVTMAIPTLLHGRVLCITSVAVFAAFDVVRLEYEMTPPVEPLDWDADDEAQAAWARGNQWLLSGRDDLGTEYDDWGGSFGLTPDGRKTDGERDLSPAPPPGATWLEITVHAGGYAVGVDHPRYTLKVGLPLAADSVQRV